MCEKVGVIYVLYDEQNVLIMRRTRPNKTANAAEKRCRRHTTVCRYKKTSGLILCVTKADYRPVSVDNTHVSAPIPQNFQLHREHSAK